MNRRAELLDRRQGATLSASDAVELGELTDRLVWALTAQPHTVRQLCAHADDDVLELLAAAEPVHPFDDPGDMDEVHSRTTGDRFCFVLENPAFSGIPLNVVWIALCEELPAGMNEILARNRNVIEPTDANVAVFYSIWSVQRGLNGIPSGSSLLSLVLERLRNEFPNITTFTTLSPVPGFRSWLEERDPATAASFDRPGGDGSTQTSQPDILDSCASYLCSTDDRGRPLDSVARFHLGNGARLWRLVPDADGSDRGWDRSWGVMVNYRYHPENLEANARAFAAGEPVISDEISARVQHA